MNKLIAIPIALTLLISSISFTISKHYCEGELIMSWIMMGEYPLGSGTKEMDNAFIHEKSHCVKHDNEPCCENKYQIIDADINYALDPLKAIYNYIFLDVSIYPDMKFAFLQKPDKSCFSGYHLTPKIKDTPVLFQIFLI